jgi:3-deoxy-manno-octulosonate cytidylyltransferase (CMP-KDO synthetase)
MYVPSSQKIIAIIPARYSSTRFPGKPLAVIAGKPMIQHVWERAKQTPSIDQVLVATDDERILNTVKDFGGEGVLTSTEHQTGTDRIVEAVSGLPCGWILNIQGDEPMILPSDLERLINLAKNTKGTKAATLIFQINDESQLNDPNVVKVTVNHNKQALYFSRSLIPHPRSSNSLQNLASPRSIFFPARFPT